MTSTISIAGRAIGPGQPPYIIAELGINHGGDPELACKLVEAAAAAGADAVKLQTFRTAEFLAADSQYFDILAGAELDEAAIARLFALAARLGVTIFSAAFDEASADLLDRLGAPCFKIASGDITHLPLLRHIGRLGKPVILSTGGSSLDEAAEAVAALRSTHAELPVAVLHCVSLYPTPPEQANLAAMAALRQRFGGPVGYSDHTIGDAVALAAVALGADVIEKHFTLDRSAPGPDNALSVDPAGLAKLVGDARTVHAALGKAAGRPEAPDYMAQIRRSLVARRDIAAGETIAAEMLAVKRPGTGLAPGRLAEVVGRRAALAIRADTPLTLDMTEA